MISQTCLIAPTGVPVDVITHWSCPLVPPVGCSSSLPIGQVVETVVAALVLAQRARDGQTRQSQHSRSGQHRACPGTATLRRV